MSAGTASLCCNLLFFSVFVFVSADPKIITAKSGQDVTLTCRAPNNNITAVHWSRADLRNKNVLLYQDGQFDPDDQHPSFKNRVDLQDRQMKDGDVSLILKDVTINDAARYKCHVLVNETDSWKLVSIINLRVSPGQKNITAKSGQDVTLTCRTPNNNIKSVHWSRADLTDEYVLFYQKGQFVPDNQHPSFKNRVDLQDRQMKDGDVSLILKDVTINDTGTYMCRVFIGETRSWKNSIIIYLSVVDPPGQKNITAESGQDVTLTCRAPYNNIKSVEWSRDDLTSGFVYLYQDGHFVPDNQHPSFKNRVDLQDRQMKDGDVSVILKDVTINDTGTYECGVQRVGGPMTLISITNLTVVDPPAQTGGVRVDEGKKEEGKKDEVKNEGGKKEEGEKDEGKKEEGKKHEVKNEGGKKEEGKKEEGKKEEGKKEEGKKDEGKKEEGKKDEGKKEEGKKEEGKKEEGKKEEGKKHEVKNEGGKKEEAKKEEGKKEEGKKEEGKKEEGKKEEGKKEEGEKDESIALQVLPLLLVAAVSVFFSHLKNKTKKNKKKTEAESKKVKGSAHLVSLLLQSQLTAGFPNMEKRALLSNPETSPSY